MIFVALLSFTVMAIVCRTVKPALLESFTVTGDESFYVQHRDRLMNMLIVISYN